MEIHDGKEHLPDEEDIYGVNDIEERERFEALFGSETQEDRLRRRRARMRILAAIVILAFAAVFALALRSILGW
ncbi:MAG TPA: hypothetical protein VFI02_16700 [Armatimonadota bacterium]|nr:hypothetical protein [Armatimonadota bacterium]